MKKTVSSLCFLVVVGAIIVGCGESPTRTATDGATQSDLEAYEAAIAEAEEMDDAGLEEEAGGEDE